MKYSIICFLLFSFLNLQVHAEAGIDHQENESISRIEPPNWWTGMKNPDLQLMIYGSDIGDMVPLINYPGVEIKRVIRVENNNYLFIDLTIAPDTKSGTFKIDFNRNGNLVESHPYSLNGREAGSASREGFDQSDVLYLITPDRFANGDPSNDNVQGMLEKADRSNRGGRHGGDLEGLKMHLPYVKEMGFTAIWINPVLENNMPEYSYHGYATTDFYKVDPRFGSNELYREFCRKANEMGISIIMDMIVNHCGSKHWWMNDMPTSDWLNNPGDYVETNHRKTVIQDPYASKADKDKFTDGWFVRTMPDMNQQNPMMANYLTQNSIWWIEYLGLSGVRMDTYPYPGMEYMADWTRKVMAEYPNFNIVGEEWFEEQPAILAFWQKGKQNANGYTSELKSLMDFPVRYALEKALNKKESWSEGWIDVYEMIGLDFLYADPSNLVTFPDNHDMNRFYTQVKEDYNLFKLGIAFVLTTRGIPQIYYGTEVLMANKEDGDHGLIREDFPGGWKGDTSNGFTGEGLSPKQKEAKAFIKKLLNWRKGSKPIHEGKLMHFIPADGVYVYFRYTDTEKIMVVLNKNKEAYKLQLGRFSEMLNGHSSAVEIISGKSVQIGESLDLVPEGPMILELN